jgi:hypothetical protein
MRGLVLPPTRGTSSSTGSPPGSQPIGSQFWLTAAGGGAKNGSQERRCHATSRDAPRRVLQEEGIKLEGLVEVE